MVVPVVPAAVPARRVSFASDYMLSCRCGGGEAHWPVHANLNSAESRAEVAADDKMAVFAIASDNMAKLLPQENRNKFPLGAGLLQKCLQSTSLKAGSKEWNQRTSAFGISRAGFSVPDKVLYPRACGEVCLESSPLDVRRAYLSMLAGLLKFAQLWKPPEVSGSDILVMMQPYAADVAADVDPALPVFFGFFALSQGKYAGEPAQQTFVELQVCNGMFDINNLCGTELEVKFDDFIQPVSVRSVPLQQQHVGAMTTYSEQELARKIVDDATFVAEGGRQICKLQRVVVRCLRFTDLSLRRVRIDGFVDAEAFEMMVGVTAKEREAKGRKQKRRVDLCGDVLKNTSGRSSAVRKAAVLEHDVLCDDAEDAVGAMKTFMEELGLDEASGLISQEEFCKAEGLMGALFSGLPAAVQTEMESIIGQDYDDHESDVAEDEPEDDDGVAEDDPQDVGEDLEDQDAWEQVAWPWTVIAEQSPYKYVDLQGQPVGQIHAVGENGLKATCRKHSKCACWVSIPRGSELTMGDVEVELIAWIAIGLECSNELHQQTSQEIRVKAGMRIRR